MKKFLLGLMITLSTACFANPRVVINSSTTNSHTAVINSNARVSTWTPIQGYRTTQSVQNFQRTYQNNLPRTNNVYTIRNQIRVRNF